MNLNDYVNKNVEDGVIFNIGNAGSGWIFCGTKEEYNKCIQMISEDYYNKYKSYYMKSWKSIEAIDIKGKKRLNVFAKGSNYKVPEPEDEWKDRILKSIELLPNLVEKRFATYYRNKEKYNSFTPFYKREVLETFNTDISKTLCIIIEGRDSGIFWTVDEFRKIYNNGRRTKNKINWYDEDSEEFTDESDEQED